MSLEYGRASLETPIESMVGKQVDVTCGLLTIRCVLTRVGTHYRASYGPVSLDFCESDILNYDRHSITLRQGKD